MVMPMNVKCSVSNNYLQPREKYCRQDGNEAENQVSPTDDGISHLVNAYRVIDATDKDPTGGIMRNLGVGSKALFSMKTPFPLCCEWSVGFNMR
jgi:hypothetical protein